ncbi:hypothetical protein L1987_33029 [Smallanthus sonchifolius]|uniref:Uncharacterized protein n=1 Tax=Smallanthus sonchifolius TaxID=185202 RepID=A0ACB9HQK3_9ASTR|nr:hypothetical protein L1987_33029 [Smallanthus sonchifolius]
MMSKGKSIAHESESNRLRKKQKIGAEGLDENILNLLSEASRNEISLLKSQYLALKEREYEVAMLKKMVLSQNIMIEALKKTEVKLNGVSDIGCSGGSSDVKDVQGSLGAKDNIVLEIVDEEDEDTDDDGVDNPNDRQGHGESGEGDESGASGEGEMEGQGGAGGDSGGGIGGDKGGDDGGNSRKGTTESDYSDLDGSDDDDIDEDEVVFYSDGDKQVYETVEGEVLKDDETVEDSDIDKFGWVFDSMNIFMFDNYDLQTLYGSPIRIGARNATREEEALYMRVVTRPLNMRKEELDLRKKLGDT